MTLTEMHPYYVNVLCQHLWLEDEVPSIDKVDDVWDRYVKGNRGIIIDDILTLTLNQKKVLSTLAENPITEIYSGEAMLAFKLTPSSIKRTIQSLLEKDLIYHHDNTYSVLDPAIRYYLLNAKL